MKSYIIKFVFLLFLSLSSTGLTHANNTNFEEGPYFVLHLNKAFFVTGEIVWYTLYTPDAMKGVEASIQVQILDKEGVVKDHYFLKTKGQSVVEGYYKIPFDWKTGIYAIAFSGVDEATKNVVSLASADFPIYNDLEKLPAGVQLATLPNTVKTEVIGASGQLDIQLGQAVYSQGDLVTANVTVKGAGGRAVPAKISVSVVDQSLAGDQILNKSSVYTFFDGKLPASPLSNDLFAFGKLSKKDGSPLMASIVGAYSPLENKVHYLKTDATGKYAIKLPDFYGEKPLQPLLYKSQEDFDVTVEKKSGSNTSPSEEVVYTQAVLDYIEESRLRKKVYQYYGGVAADLNVQKTSVERVKLKPGLTYKLSEYETFDNVGEFFIEVQTPLKFKVNKDDTFSADIVNPRQYTSKTRTLDGDPLFIIDGKVTKDADFLGKLNVNQIDEVKLHYNPNKLNDHFRAIAVGGIAEISSTSDDFHVPLEDEEDIFIAKGIQGKGTFTSEKSNSNAPNFKPQLYWNPMIQTSKSGKAEVKFQQSDDVSTFVIKVVAQTENGEMMYGEKTYEVKRRN